MNDVESSHSAHMQQARKTEMFNQQQQQQQQQHREENKETSSPDAHTDNSASGPMSRAPFQYCEEARLAAVLRLSLRDSPREPQFDSITEAAALICNAPAALISIVDQSHTWFKSSVGFGDATSTRREWTVCEHVIRTNDLLVVEDLSKDVRFQANPFVHSAPNMRFYAGAPLTDPESGQAVGALCVVDYKPRQLNDLQRTALNLLARQVMAACESRLRILKLQEALEQLEETRGALAASEEQAKRAQKQAEQANLAKSEFLANMSHEIRTPLNGVLGTASLLAETTRLDGEQKDYVRVIQSSGEHLLIVLNDILDFSKFESGKLEIDAGVVDTHSLLEQAIELSFRSKPNLELVYEIREDVPKAILADATRLRQIVANLISNAVKFTNYGEIRIGVEVMTEAQIEEQQRPQMAQVASAANKMMDAPAAPTAAAAQSINQRIRASRDFDDEAPSSPSSSATLLVQSAPSSAAAAASSSDPSTDGECGSLRKKRRLHNDITIESISTPAMHHFQHSPTPSARSTVAASAAAASASENGDVPMCGLNLAATSAAASSSSAAAAAASSMHSTRSRPSSAASLRSLADDPGSLMLVFSVSDTGIGIDSSKIHKLFSAFTQLDISITREYGGTGLGLAISARLAQLMGGTMWVKSEVGKGSTFFFSIRTKPQYPAMAQNSPNDDQMAPSTPVMQLPDSAAAPAAAQHPLAAHFPAWGEIGQHPRTAKFIEGRTHALVVEPNEALLRSLATQLRAWGLIPLEFTSIQAAQAALQDSCNEVVKYHHLAAIVLSQPRPPSGSEFRLSPQQPDGSALITVPCSLIQQLRIADSQANARAVRPDCHCAAASGGGCVSSSSTTFEYVVPAIILLPTLTEEEQVAALATPRPTAPPINRAECSKNCNILRKPVLLSQLKKKLDRAFRVSLFGKQSQLQSQHQQQQQHLAEQRASADQRAAAAAGASNEMLRAATAAFVAATTATSAAAAAFAEAAAAASSSASASFLAPVASHTAALAAVAAAATGVPASSSSSIATALSPPPPSFSATYPLRIMSVEDNTTNMKLTVRMLRSLGYTDVIQAWNGQECVDLVVNQGARVDVILMDNQMPVLSGPQACRIICAYYSKIAQAVNAMEPAARAISLASAPTAPIIIALTASCMESDREHALATGHDDFLSKPLSLPVLRQKLQHWAVRIHQQKQAQQNAGSARIVPMVTE